MAAQRHIHLHPRQAQGFGVCDRQVVRLQTMTARPVIFEDVVVRVSPDYEAAVHLDYDEANACGLRPGAYGRILP
jgi:propanediol utilization protein